MKNIVFVGGIHGVGKGKFCAEVATNLKYIHLTASEVIKWSEISAENNKAVKDLTKTQDRLLTNLKKIVEQDQQYLLDGHFCLLDNNDKPQKIPLSTFVDISPQKLILIYEDISVIKDRLKVRDAKNYNKEILQEFQNLERSYAREISLKLNIPLLELKSTSDNYIVQIKNYLT